MKIFAAWIVVVTTSWINPCLAQFPNYTVFQESGSSTGGPSIAINPRNPSIIVSASAPDNVFYSTDGGKTWNKNKLKSPFGSFGKPQVLCDGKGVFYLIHESDANGKGLSDEKSLEVLVCHVSSDGGKTWDEGTPFGYNAPKDQVHPFASMDSKGNLWVTWTQYDKYASSDSTCYSSVMMTSSSNGRKWSKSVEISQVKGSCRHDDNTISAPSISVSDDKKVYAAWAAQNVIFLDRSFDGGNMWLTNDIIVTHQKGGWNFPIAGHGTHNGIPVLLMDKTKTDRNGLLFLVWADQRKGDNNSDIWFLRSNNYGDIWTSPLRVNNEDDKDQYMPAMTVDNSTGNIYILYFSRNADDSSKADVYLGYSQDSGNTFRNVRISEAPFTPQAQSVSGADLAISAYKGVIVAMWARSDNGTASIVNAVIPEGDLPK